MDADIRRSVSEFLKKYRTQRKLTQEQLAEKLHYSSKMIANWEQCVNDIPMDVILKLRKETETPIDEILGLKFDKEYEDIDDRVLQIALEYTYDKGNLQYVLTHGDYCYRDENDIIDTAVNNMAHFLDEIGGTCEAINFDKKVRVNFIEEVVSTSEFIHLVRKEYITPIYVPNGERDEVKVEYEIDKDFYIFIKILRLNTLVYEVKKLLKDDPNDSKIEKLLEKVIKTKESYEKTYNKIMS